MEFWRTRSEDPALLLSLSCRESECGGVRGEAEEDPGVSQHPSGQPPAPGPPEQTPGPGQPAQSDRAPAAGSGLRRGRLQALCSKVRRLHPPLCFLGRQNMFQPSFFINVQGVLKRR